MSALFLKEKLLLQDQMIMHMAKNLPLNALFISCILKVNNTLIDNAEDLDIVMPMYNLTEYSKSFSKASGSL